MLLHLILLPSWHVFHSILFISVFYLQFHHFLMIYESFLLSMLFLSYYVFCELSSFRFLYSFFVLTNIAIFNNIFFIQKFIKNPFILYSLLLKKYGKKCLYKMNGLLLFYNIVNNILKQHIIVFPITEFRRCPMRRTVT